MKTVTVKNVVIGEGITKICVPIVGQTKQKILQQTQNAMISADLLEWRVDWYEHCFDKQNVIDVLKEIRQIAKQMPIIFTFRTKQEGGEKEITKQCYFELLSAVMESGQADIVDIQFEMGDIVKQLQQKAKACSVYTIFSYHNFQKTPSQQEMLNCLKAMQSQQCDISKIAVMPQNKMDVLNLFHVCEQMQNHFADRPFIVLSMAVEGVSSRILAEWLGSAVTFGAGEKSSAPGQIEAPKLKQLLEVIHESII